MIQFLAQVATNAAGAAVATAPVWNVDAILTLAVPVVAPLLTAAIKKWGPLIPSWALPMICTGLGTLGTYIAQWSTGTPTNAAMAVGLGLAGIGVREVLDQLKPSPNATVVTPIPPTPPPTTTK